MGAHRCNLQINESMDMGIGIGIFHEKYNFCYMTEIERLPHAFSVASVHQKMLLCMR